MQHQFVQRRISLIDGSGVVYFASPFSFLHFIILFSGMKNLLCSDRSESDWTNTKFVFNSYLYDSAHGEITTDTTRECLMVCERWNRSCYSHVFGQSCVWYELSPSRSYGLAAVAKGSDEAFTRICSAGTHCIVTLFISTL